jgi:2'-hydroxyisoflavone reductase
VPDDVLLAAGVEPWMELPMWAPDTPEFAAIWEVSGDRALRTGIRYRPLTDTVHDTWSWLRRDAAAAGEPAFEHRPGIGLDPAKEQSILATLD